MIPYALTVSSYRLKANGAILLKSLVAMSNESLRHHRKNVGFTTSRHMGRYTTCEHANPSWHATHALGSRTGSKGRRGRELALVCRVRMTYQVRGNEDLRGKDTRLLCPNDALGAPNIMGSESVNLTALQRYSAYVCFIYRRRIVNQNLKLNLKNNRLSWVRT